MNTSLTTILSSIDDISSKLNTFAERRNKRYECGNLFVWLRACLTTRPPGIGDTRTHLIYLSSVYCTNILFNMRYSTEQYVLFGGGTVPAERNKYDISNVLKLIYFGEIYKLKMGGGGYISNDLSKILQT